MPLTDSKGRALLTLPIDPSANQGDGAVQGVVLVDQNGNPMTLQITVQVGEGGGGGASAADQVSYSNAGYPALANVQEALDQILFVPMTVHMSGGGNYDKGQVLTSVSLSWGASKSLTSQSLAGPDVTQPAPTDTSQTVTGSFSSNTTWTVTCHASDGTEVLSASTSLNFMDRRYWGVSASANLTDAEVQALTSTLASSRQMTQSFSPAGGYIWFAWPTAWGEPTFVVGGLTNTAWVETVQDFTNAYGYTESYNLYRSTYTQNGTGIQVVVQ
jgi:hypothetical protein